MYREPFVDESTSKTIVSKTFITVGITIAAMAFTMLFIWSYQKSYKLFISIFSIMVFAFALFTVIVVTLTRSKMTELQFRIYLSITVFMTLMSLIMFIFFTILAVNHLKRINMMGIPTGSMANPITPSYSQTPYGATPTYDTYATPAQPGYTPPRQSML